MWPEDSSIYLGQSTRCVKTSCFYVGLSASWPVALIMLRCHVSLMAGPWSPLFWKHHHLVPSSVRRLAVMILIAPDLEPVSRGLHISFPSILWYLSPSPFLAFLCLFFPQYQPVDVVTSDHVTRYFFFSLLLELCKDVWRTSATKKSTCPSQSSLVKTSHNEYQRVGHSPVAYSPVAILLNCLNIRHQAMQPLIPAVVSRTPDILAGGGRPQNVLPYYSWKPSQQLNSNCRQHTSVSAYNECQSCVRLYNVYMIIGHSTGCWRLLTVHPITLVSDSFHTIAPWSYISHIFFFPSRSSHISMSSPYHLPFIWGCWDGQEGRPGWITSEMKTSGRRPT